MEVGTKFSKRVSWRGRNLKPRTNNLFFIVENEPEQMKKAMDCIYTLRENNR
jgi:hypothetical protein